MIRPTLLSFGLLALLACGGGSDDGGASPGTGVDTSHALFWDATPPSTLLPPGATTLAFTVKTNRTATCRYSVGQALAFDAMRPFTSTGGTTHSVTFQGLDPDTTRVNEVYVRCDAVPNEVLHLRYRALPAANPSFPRKGNLWGSWEVQKNGGLEHCKRMDLWLGAGFSEQEVHTLRGLNPEVLILDSINVVEHSDAEQLNIPDGYWLKDTTGKRIEVWNGAYRLNLTKPEVASYQAQFAYQRFLDKNLCMDGTFFDNFFTSQSWVTKDMWGNAVQIDANGDGLPDDPAWLDAAWKAGVYAELQEWRRLMPHAYATGHLPDPAAADTGAIFNGDSIGFDAPGAKDGRYTFPSLWENYHGWWQRGRTPLITMVESGPPFEIAYGYGYQPYDAIPASTLEFARTYYPYMRFGLGLTLMNDGFFAHEFGDTWHGNDWWYDELDFNLGQPTGPHFRVDMGLAPTTDPIVNGGFEQDLAPGWTNWVNTTTGAAATFSRDTSQASAGGASCHASITNAGEGADWHIALFQKNLSVTQGISYDLSFKIKADAGHPFSVALQKGSSDWHSYGLSKELTATPTWTAHTVTFESTETAADGRLSFNVGSRTGIVWIDDVKLVQHPPDVYRRDFDHGTVILNGTRKRLTVPVTGSFQRLTGAQAPRYQYVVDDADTAFTAGSYQTAAYDSGQWVAQGPWYHDWGTGCHQSSASGQNATWDLGLRADDTYTLDAWWPAAPAASTWSSQVRYEVIVGGSVIATATLDQSQGGDQWHRIASVALTQAAGASVRITNLQNRPAIADALLVQSAARYNDGSEAPSVELDAMDAILLQKK